MLKKELVVIMLIMSCFGFAQNADMTWSSTNKLKWSDFKGAVKYSSPYAATTYSGISYGYSASVTNGVVKADFTITSFFDAQQSWVKPKDADSYLLAHEQLHFDITELYTRKFRKQLSTMTFSDNIKSEVKKVYSTINEAKRQRQELYDHETNHSKNRLAQKRWNEMIAKELEKLRDFASDK